MSKKKVNGRNKGSDFERKCCQLLQAWWQRGTFMRTKNLQILARDERGIQGDIACLLERQQLDPDFPYSVEVKKREGWDFADLLKGNCSGTIIGFWNQCTFDAKRFEKFPLLLISRNNYGVYAIQSEQTPPSITETYDPVRAPLFWTILNGQWIRICTWEAFAGYFTPTHLKGTD